MRGARVQQQGITAGRGIIPADAGSTLIRATHDGLTEDHPRGCGEHYYLSLCWLVSIGSSPRMRGALNTLLDKIKPKWIIPADAGSTEDDLIAFIVV